MNYNNSNGGLWTVQIPKQVFKSWLFYSFCAERWIKLWVWLSKNWSCRAWLLHSSTKIQIILRHNVFHLQIWAVSNTISWILCHCIASNCRNMDRKQNDCILLPMFTSTFETAVMRSAANTLKEVRRVVSLKCIVNPTWRPLRLECILGFYMVEGVIYSLSSCCRGNYQHLIDGLVSINFYQFFSSLELVLSCLW